MRVIVFGSPEFAVPSLEALIGHGHEVAAVVTQPDRPKGRGQKLEPTAVKVRAHALGIPVWQPAAIKTLEFLDQVRALGANLGVVAAYGRILPEQLLQAPALGMINVHASLLPKYRGAAPIHRAVIAGATETGVTIMQVVRELDAGPMLAAERCPIGPDETSEALERRLAHLGAALLAHVVDALGRGAVAATAQDDREATYAPRLTKDESPVDWNERAGQIHNKVRGLTPWPLAHSSIRGRRLVLHRTTPAGSGAAGRRPGEVVDVSAAGVAVACGDDSRLTILEVQPEGRRRMSVRDYVSGHTLLPGDRFDSGT